MAWWVECRSLDKFPASRDGYVPVYGPFTTQEEAARWRSWAENFLRSPTSRTAYRTDVV